MILSRILYRHGGRVVSIGKIGHATTPGRKGLAHWFYVGTVQWDGGGPTTDGCEIPPHALSVDHEDHVTGDAEFRVLTAKLAAYMMRAGSWERHSRVWVPIKPAGDKPIEAC